MYIHTLAIHENIVIRPIFLIFSTCAYISLKQPVHSVMCVFKALTGSANREINIRHNYEIVNFLRKSISNIVRSDK